MLCFKDVAKIVADVYNYVFYKNSYYYKIKTEDVMPNNSFNGLGFNYLAYKKLSSLIYLHFNIEILPENLNTFKTIGNLYKYIDCYRILKN